MPVANPARTNESCAQCRRLAKGNQRGNDRQRRRLGIRLKINRQKLKHFNFYVKVKILLTQL